MLYGNIINENYLVQENFIDQDMIVLKLLQENIDMSLKLVIHQIDSITESSYLTEADTSKGNIFKQAINWIIGITQKIRKWFGEKIKDISKKIKELIAKFRGKKGEPISKSDSNDKNPVDISKSANTSTGNNSDNINNFKQHKAQSEPVKMKDYDYRNTHTTPDSYAKRTIQYLIYKECPDIDTSLWLQSKSNNSDLMRNHNYYTQFNKGNYNSCIIGMLGDKLKPIELEYEDKVLDYSLFKTAKNDLSELQKLLQKIQSNFDTYLKRFDDFKKQLEQMDAHFEKNAINNSGSSTVHMKTDNYSASASTELEYSRIVTVIKTRLLIMNIDNGFVSKMANISFTFMNVCIQNRISIINQYK